MPQSPGAIRASVLVFLAALSTLAVGALILAGGPTRFTSPALATARAVAPWWGWGSAMLLSGLLATGGAWAHRMWLARIGHTMSSAVYLFWVITLGFGVARTPTTAMTGLGIYTGFAMIHAFAAATADLELSTRHANATSTEARRNYDRAMRDEV